GAGDACHGDGRGPTQQCRECRGRGRRVVKRKLEVEVPAGISDGQRIRLSGRGHAGELGAPAGDLYVLARVAEDSRFVREGSDLITVVDVAAPPAAARGPPRGAAPGGGGAAGAPAGVQ